MPKTSTPSVESILNTIIEAIVAIDQAGIIRNITDVKQYLNDFKKQSEFKTAVLNAVRSLIFVLDRRGRIVSFNRACEETTGYSFQEVVGKPFWAFFIPMQDRDLVTKNFMRVAPDQLTNNFESVWLTKKGEKRLIAWSNSLTFNKQNSMEYVICTGIDITEHRQLEDMVLEIAKKERERIGQELHDGVAQQLASTAVVAKVLEKKLAEDSLPLECDAKHIVEMINQVISRIRELAQGFYSLEMQSEDFISSLKKLTQDTEMTTGIRCTFQSNVASSVLSKGAATHFYRIAREAVNNAVKHGLCKNIWVKLRKNKARRLELKVENDGRPFSEPRSKQKGIGMRIMRSRASILNASLTIVPRSKGGGTIVSCVLPVSL